MPETALTPLKLTTGSSSINETEAATTRTPTSSGVANEGKNSRIQQAKKRQQQEQNKEQDTEQANAVQSKKLRKSLVHRNSKKTPLKVNSQQKIATVARNIRSQIPRASDLISSSTLSTNVSVTRSLERSTTSIIPPRHLLQRQNTAFVNFRIKKSISQMDFSHSRRTTNLHMPISQHLSHNATGLVSHDSGDVSGRLMVTSSQTAVVQKIFNQDDYYYIVQNRDPRVAGMKIFATIMLNAWRKRRYEVKQLIEEVNDLKRGSVKTKNQLHVFNTLFRVEQRRNDELNCHLKRSLNDITDARSSCENLTASLISIKADNAFLQQQMEIKTQEFDGLNTILCQTKSDLFKSMAKQRELQATLSTEQRKVQILENQNNELIKEICELNNISLQNEEKFREEIKLKQMDLEQTTANVKSLQQLVDEMKKKDYTISEYVDSEAKLKKQIESLQANINMLQQCLNATLGQRMKAFWNNTLIYQKATFSVIHWIAFYMLPATPPPKITALPFGLTLEKALSIVKR